MKIIAKVLDKKPQNHSGLWLSVSKIKTFKQCPAKYRYLYIDKRPTKSWDHLLFGNFLHEVLELFHKAIMNGSTLTLDKLMTDIFAKVSLSKDYQGKISIGQKNEAFGILKKYLLVLQDSHPNVTNVELSFYVDINNKIMLTGLIDRVQDDNGLLHVSDYKTTKKKKYLENDDFQLLTYAYVMCLQDKNIEKIKTSYILLRHNFDYISKIYNRDSVMKMGQTFIDIANDINREKLWRPNVSPLCNYCDFQDVCTSGNKFGDKSKKRKADVQFGFQDW